MRSARDICERLSRFIDHHRRCGYIADGRILLDDYRDGIRVALDLRSGERLSYEFLSHEFRMDGEAALAHWVARIEDDIMRRTFHRWDGTTPPRQNMTATEVQMRQQAAPARTWIDEFAGITPTMIDAMAMAFAPPLTVDKKAEKKSKDLFILACGKEAFDTVESGGALPITGSNGTAYTLHKRASYCVERVKDGAKLCAVVPGVPLWDHLLGIKLMVENDEPQFLKTANVSGGATNSRPGGITWADADYDHRRLSASITNDPNSWSV